MINNTTIIIILTILVILVIISVVVWYSLKKSKSQPGKVESNGSGQMSMLDRLDSKRLVRLSSQSDETSTSDDDCTGWCGYTTYCTAGGCCSLKNLVPGLLSYFQTALPGFIFDTMTTKDSSGIAPTDLVTTSENVDLGLEEIHVRVFVLLSPFCGFPNTDYGTICTSQGDGLVCDGQKAAASNGCQWAESGLTNCGNDFETCATEVGNGDTAGKYCVGYTDSSGDSGICVPFINPTSSDGCACECINSPIAPIPKFEIKTLIMNDPTTAQINDGYALIFTAVVDIQDFAFWSWIWGNATSGETGSGAYFQGTVTASFNKDKYMTVQLGIKSNMSGDLVTVLGLNFENGNVNTDTSDLNFHNTSVLSGTIDGDITAGIEKTFSEQISKQITGLGGLKFMSESQTVGLIETSVNGFLTSANINKFFSNFVFPIQYSTTINVIGATTVTFDSTQTIDITQNTPVVSSDGSTISIGITFNTDLVFIVTQDSSGLDVCPLLSPTDLTCNQIPSGTVMTWTLSLDGTADNQPKALWLTLMDFTIVSPLETIVTDALQSDNLFAAIETSFEDLMTLFYECGGNTAGVMTNLTCNQANHSSDCVYGYICGNQNTCVPISNIFPDRCTTNDICGEGNCLEPRYVLSSSVDAYYLDPTVNDCDTMANECNTDLGVCTISGTTATAGSCTTISDCQIYENATTGTIPTNSTTDRYGTILTVYNSLDGNMENTCTNGLCTATDHP